MGRMSQTRQSSAKKIREIGRTNFGSPKKKFGDTIFYWKKQGEDGKKRV
jgi:hypothetical protein